MGLCMMMDLTLSVNMERELEGEIIVILLYKQ